MQEKVYAQANIISQQQKFLEVLDRKEREANIVLLGVPDEGETLDGANNDEEKINKLIAVLGVERHIQLRSHRRLGRNDATSGRKRPILVVLDSKDRCDRILRETRKLKDRGAPFDRIFIKKDLHPAVREEWRRLRAAEATEKNRPENQGCEIRLDARERKLYRDGTVIDEWKCNYF